MSLQTRTDAGESSGFDASTDSLGDMFYPLYERLFDENSDFVADVETKLAQARMADTVEMYLSRSLGIGVLSGGALWALGTVIGYLLFMTGIVPTDNILGATIPNQALVDLVNAVKVPALVVVTGLFLGSIGFAMGFGALVAVPYSRASARKREINMLLTDAVSFMYALSVGGLNQLEILEAMAKAEDTYGEVAKEFQSIVQETEYFDTDYRTAIRNQAMETPSDEVAQFLTDMLSIVNSGGDMENFLKDKKDKHMRTAKQQQEMTLETLELFGEMYMTLSLFPLLLIIILVIMRMLGEADAMMLYATVYGLIPMTGAGFLVLVSTVKQDEPGDGYLNPADADDRLSVQKGSGLLNLGLVEEYTGEFSMFDRIKNKEGTYETMQVLKAPHLFFRDNPLYTLALTVPLVLVITVVAMVSGAVPTSWDGMIDQPVWGTFMYVYMPTYIVVLPLAVFREWNVRSRSVITNSISDNLRKLSSANDTGQTLLESLRTVSETTSGKMATEFETMHAKVNYGMSLKHALVEFNNKYHIPRMARTVKLISKAQEASSQITDVLTTAAQASENQDDIERERKSRTRMQVVIILMTYLTLLAVMAILKTQFLDVLTGLNDASGGGGGGASGGPSLGGAVNTGRLSLLFFHAVTMQALLSGLIAGYIRDADIMSGMKFVLVLMTIALVVWAAVA
ncbi:type II secretion system F family protein [Haloarchaeobius iranensis]|uniref:Flagellar protein FlaJ n=1 Tax=Haloarchaeobius iranensis TaxID=996166 RepID=A0A1G9WHQ3_9EURY|nr:type II secretion system F family protein [Haloarchaeobius iranensis]SDM83773.1 flagellar protein FlaJ [Haloarchaeobius iranensis]